jgi:hypothetical protein
LARKKRPDRPGAFSTEMNGPLNDDGPTFGADELVGPPAPSRREPEEPPAPLPSPAPLPPSVPTPPVAAIVSPENLLEDRLRKLEATLTQLQQIEQRLQQIQNAPVATVAPPPPAAITTAPSEKNSLLSSAASLLSASTSLLPSFITGADPTKPKDPYSLAETLAELRAMHRMFVDPRYTMSWVGRIGPPVLLLAFLFPSFWVPGATVLAWVVCPIGQLLVGFGLFKVLGYEARRYRERAPDLPPSLRL